MFGSSVLAQQKVRGIVTSADKSPLIGVTVLVEGSAIGTSTDTSGHFSITAKKGDVLLFSFVGFASGEIKINNEDILNVTLSESISDLNEVVVTGYTTQRVKDITGSVAVVKRSDLLDVPAGQIEQMLQGRAAGLTVITSGEPGSSSIVRIHGIGNLGNVTPLYIIDGVQGDINSLNPYDIESLQVLKDAGAYSIYGVRGANGVIVITTKKGKNNKTTINYDFYMGLQEPLHKGPDLLNPTEFANLYWKALNNSNQIDPGTGRPYNPNLYGDSTVPVLPDYFFAGNSYGLFEGDPRVNPDLYTLDSPSYQIVRFNKNGTDWFHEMFKPAFSQSHTISASGGNEKSNYFFSLGYLDQQGTLINTYLKRFTARINTNFNVKNLIRFGENVQLSYSDNPRSTKYSVSATNANALTNSYYGDISAALTTATYVPLYDIKGAYSSGGGPNAGPAGNPVAVRMLSKNNKNLSWRVFGNAYAEVDFLKYFTVRSSFGGTLDNYYGYTYDYGTYDQPTSNRFTENSGFTSSWTWTNTINFSHLFGKQKINVLAGAEQVNNYQRGLSGSKVGYFTNDPNYRFLSNGSPVGQTTTSAAYTSFLSSFISRADYSYDDKYLLSVTVRRDASSLFSAEKRFGWFPSFSAAWRMTEENFMKNSKWLTDFKLRASWGKTGYDGNTDPLNQYTLYGGDITNSYYDISGSITSAAPGFRTTYIGNPATGWQQDVVTNVGFETILWNGKFKLTADWYIKKTNGLLLPAILPDILGDGNVPNINIGDIQNTGIDLLVASKGKFSENWKWDVAVTFTTYNNKIVKLNGSPSIKYYNSQFVGLVNNAVGHPVGSFYGYKVTGYFKDNDDVFKSPTQQDAGPGRFKYLDANGDGHINDSDMVFTGNPNPKFTTGINIGISYKNFDFSTFFYGSFGNDVLNGVRWAHNIFATGSDAKSKTALYDSWTPQHMQAKAPIAEFGGNFSNGTQPDSYPVESGSYLRNKSMIVGYTLPRNILQKIKFNTLRVYIQVTNLFTITKYSGLDPELSGSTIAFGIDGGNYPNNQKQYLIGVNLNF